MATKAIEVKELVSRDAARMQSLALDDARQAIGHAEYLLKLDEVIGDHRLQLKHALALFTEAADFLGDVMMEASAEAA